MNLSYKRPALRQILICLVLFVLLIGTAMTSTTDRHVTNQKRWCVSNQFDSWLMFF